MFLYLTILLVVLGSYALYKIVKLGTDRLFPDPPANEAKATEEVIQKGIAISLDKSLSIPDKYYYALENPLEFSEQERNAITEDYRDLLNGKSLDPDAFHIPHERVDGYINKDYITYLENQAKKLGPDSWHKAELKRIRKIQKHEMEAIDFPRT